MTRPSPRDVPAGCDGSTVPRAPSRAHSPSQARQNSLSASKHSLSASAITSLDPAPSAKSRRYRSSFAWISPGNVTESRFDGSFFLTVILNATAAPPLLGFLSTRPDQSVCHSLGVGDGGLDAVSPTHR